MLYNKCITEGGRNTTINTWLVWQLFFCHIGGVARAAVVRLVHTICIRGRGINFIRFTWHIENAVGLLVNALRSLYPPTQVKSQRLGRFCSSI